MKKPFLSATAVLAISGIAMADIIPTESNSPASSPNARIVRSQMEKVGMSSTEALAVAKKLDDAQIEFFARSEQSTAVVGALLPEEWLGSALMFYATAPWIEINIRKYIMNQSNTTNPVFNWKPFDFLW